MGLCVGDVGSHDCRSMWVHGSICPKVHVHNSGLHSSELDLVVNRVMDDMALPGCGWNGQSDTVEVVSELLQN